jgi:murein DD-endopeptidase MepM/ murein hydrolase activator NlpD
MRSSLHLVKWRAAALAGAIFALCATRCPDAAAEDFSYMPAGQLVAGSGEGRADNRVYVPGMRFPIEETPAYANSQVWGPGGMHGGGGSQCDTVNYSYPWWDNYCETRSWEMPLCPAGTGHQGQDLRPATCDDNMYWCVAVDDGTITQIGSYSVWLVTTDGTQHRYLHMAPDSLLVAIGDKVVRGQRLGRVSNAFGTSSTTIHLHYDIFQNLQGYGGVYVPPYTSLIQAYQALLTPPDPDGSVDVNVEDGAVSLDTSVADGASGDMPMEIVEDEGCACSLGARPRSPLALVLLLALLLAARCPSYLRPKNRTERWNVVRWILLAALLAGCSESRTVVDGGSVDHGSADTTSAQTDSGQDLAHLPDGQGPTPDSPTCSPPPDITHCQRPPNSHSQTLWYCDCGSCGGGTPTAACNGTNGDCRIFADSCIPQTYTQCGPNAPDKILGLCGACFFNDGGIPPHCDKLPDAGP